MVPETLPLLPIRDAVVFPSMVLPLFVSRDASIKALEAALADGRLVALATQRDPDVEDPGPDDLYAVGTLGMLMRLMHLPDGRVKVLIQGLSKVRLRHFLHTEPYIEVEVEAIEADPVEAEPNSWTVEIEALFRSVRDKLELLLPLRQVPAEVASIASHVDEPGRLADLVASNLELRTEEAQSLLEIEDPIRRLRKIDAVLSRELEVSSVQAEIQSTARDELMRSQRDHFLREQLRAIRSELGESEEKNPEVEELRSRIETAGMNAEARAEAERQFERLTRMHPDSSEVSIVRSYLEWMADLPWEAATEDNLDLSRAREVLEHDHAYLDRVKERILEYLAAHKLRGGGVSKGPILCLVGPPGVGKTSLGQSIARAMGRNFVRMSLGGIRDEAEIRGHRRTYVGALPGRILHGMRQAGSANPVFLLDELDKLGADQRGDPASAMLEVLDPEQNSNFRDHYLNVPYDLSKVLFIATANLVDSIPRALLDRTEVIRIPGYTHEEKEQIARRFLLARQLEEAGVGASQLTISGGAIRETVRRYTQEAGVRSLERELGRMIRKGALQLAEGECTKISISRRNLRRFLGPAPVPDGAIPHSGEVGVAIGLAWTEAGGETLVVEASLLRGRGLTLTGHLGAVMKESGQAALSYVRTRAPDLGLSDSLNRSEVHLHVPAGATPKDGPSAGVTMATALFSALSGIPARTDVAMTGEITLRGRVLPVGGVREKALAAYRRGIRTLILPEANRHDLEEVPPELTRQMEFHFVTRMDEVFPLALTKPLGPRRNLRPRRVRPARVSS